MGARGDRDVTIRGLLYGAPDLEHPRKGNVLSIHDFDDDFLINIFYFYQLFFLGESRKDTAINRKIEDMGPRIDSHKFAKDRETSLVQVGCRTKYDILGLGILPGPFTRLYKWQKHGIAPAWHDCEFGWEGEITQRDKRGLASRALSRDIIDHRSSLNDESAIEANWQDRIKTREY